MPDLRNPKLLYLKGVLFVIVGCLASVILLVKHPSVEVAVLLALTVWAFARAYYFAFYVVEHYIDADQKFAGLIPFLRYVLRQRRDGGGDGQRHSGK